MIEDKIGFGFFLVKAVNNLQSTALLAMQWLGERDKILQKKVRR